MPSCTGWGVGFFNAYSLKPYFCTNAHRTLELEGEYVLDQINNPPEFFPKGLISFARDGSGNDTCFDYRHCKENPPIFFWHHEVEENEGVFSLGDSLINSLTTLKVKQRLKHLANKKSKNWLYVRAWIGSSSLLLRFCNSTKCWSYQEKFGMKGFWRFILYYFGNVGVLGLEGQYLYP